MSMSRRDFMKLFGISVASLLLPGCRVPVPVSCYAPMPPSLSPTELLTAREQLRLCWLSFGELVQLAKDSEQGLADQSVCTRWVDEHRAALDELVAAGELTTTVAALVQEAYEAAVNHVWLSNIYFACYTPEIINYRRVSAGIFVQQAEALAEVADQGQIDPEILAKARAALEHDMAFYDLSSQQYSELYNRLIQQAQQESTPIPPFEDVELVLSPDARAAAQFIIDLLTQP